ncbi:MAG: cupin domain-containing protein [Spirochaetota bacterium]|nr:MAG: cupin domain-containing protein [Spirochaetota bacterium]
MLTRIIDECEAFIAGDNTTIKEILHPYKEDLEIRYSLAHASLKEGKASIPHRLKTSEVYYILNGKGVMHIDDESNEVSSNHSVYIPPNALQYIQNTGDSELTFLCIVDPAWREEDEEIL